MKKIITYINDEQKADEITEVLLKEKLVACVPGSGFGSEGYIRLSYAASVDNINKALTLLDEWVRSLK